MPFTANDFHDLVRLLAEHPEWRADLRRLVLSEELLGLPDLMHDLAHEVRELAAAQQRAEERLARVEEGQARLEARQDRLEAAMAALVEAQQRTDQQLAALTAAQQRTDEALRALTERVDALAAAQQRTEEQLAALAAAQQRTDELLVALTEAQQRTDELLRELIAIQRRAEERLGWLEDRVSRMIGQLLELRYREHAPAYFGPIVRRALAVPVHDLDALLDESKERGLLSEDDAREVLLADLVIRGRRREDGQEIYVLVEVSYTIYPHDVERAVRRAELLSRVRPTVPAVAGEGILADARSRAERHGAWVVLDGRVAVPEGR